MSKTKTKIDSEKLQVASETLRALCHPLRMAILEFIDQNQEINVNKIYNTLKLEQSITSQHLRILRQAGIVATEREGKFIYYNIDYQKIEDTLNAINVFMDMDEGEA